MSIRNDPPVSNRYGELLRAHRERAGYKLREFARVLGVSAVYLSDIELGKRAAFDGSRTTLAETRLGMKDGLLHRAAIKDYCARKGYRFGLGRNWP